MTHPCPTACHLDSRDHYDDGAPPSCEGCDAPVLGDGYRCATCGCYAHDDCSPPVYDDRGEAYCCAEHLPEAKS